MNATATATLRALRTSITRRDRKVRKTNRPPRLETLEHRQMLAADLSFAFSDPLETETTEGPGEFATPSLPPSTYQEAGLMIDHGNAANGLPLLSSNPSAAAKVYLDFDGHFEPQWGSYSNITTPVWSLDSDLTTYNSTEAAGIRAIWQRVAEDFAPFNLDVTTIEPDSFANREGLRVAIGGNSSWLGATYTGVAYRNTWTNSIVNTVYVFPAHLSNNIKYIAEVASHEVGHAFGLHHQSTYDSSGNLVREYSTGSGNWAPIMGNGLTKARTTWHDGTSISATTYQDDLAVISRTFNAFGYRQDDHGGLDSPTVLTLDDSGNAQVVGVIERNNDIDAFTFEVTASSVGDFQVDVFEVGPNLRAKLELWTDDGQLLVAANPDSTFGASFTYELDPGHYTLAVRNDGSYGSLGHYTVNVALDVLTPPPDDEEIEETETTPPTAELTDPAPDSLVERNTLNTRGYLDVTFADADSGLDTSSILDSGAEFTLVGTAANNVVVSGVPTWISGTTYRYGFTGEFAEGLVEVHFLANSFQDQVGNGNLASVQSFTVFEEASDIEEIEEILLDSESGQGVTIAGTWHESTAVPQYHGANYLHDNNFQSGKGHNSVTYTPTVVASGQYEVYLIWAEHLNRASNVPVDIVHAGGTNTVSVNQRVNGGTWNLLGTFTFDTGTAGQVRIRTGGTNGVVIADAVRFVPVTLPSNGPLAMQDGDTGATLQSAHQGSNVARHPQERLGADVSQGTSFGVATARTAVEGDSLPVVDHVERLDGIHGRRDAWWSVVAVKDTAEDRYFSRQGMRAGGESDFELLGEDVLDLLAKRS